MNEEIDRFLKYERAIVAARDNDMELHDAIHDLIEAVRELTLADGVLMLRGALLRMEAQIQDIAFEQQRVRGEKLGIRST